LNPSFNYRTIQRLQFEVSDVGAASRLLSKILVKFSCVTVISKKEIMYYSCGSGPLRIVTPSLAIVAKTTFAIPDSPPELTFALTFAGDSMELLLSSDSGADSDFLLEWLLRIMVPSLPNPSSRKCSDGLSGSPSFAVFALLSVQIVDVSAVKLDLELELDFGSGPGEEEGLYKLLFNYSWSSGFGSDLQGSGFVSC
jgi:hypothetical protein